MSKFCVKCGAELEDDAVFCDDCGTQQVVQQVPVETVAGSLPNKNQLVSGEKRKHSGFGIASFVLGILSALTFGIFFVPEILGIIFGIVGLTDKSKKMVLAVIGLVLSIIGLGIFAIILLI